MTIVYQAFTFRLYPTAEQAALFAKTFGCARVVYNKALALKMATYAAEGKTLSQFDLSKRITAWKKEEETKWLKEVDAQSLQCEMANLDAAYTKFFREKKGFPRFKSKRDHRSYSTKCRISVGDDYVKLLKVGKVKATIHRPVIGRIQKATISQTATGKYFVSIRCTDDKEDIPVKSPVTDSGTIGIDLGLMHFATLSTGEKIANPRPLKKAQKRLRRSQRKLSRRSKLSNRRKKQRRVVAAIHEKITNKRKDFQHKLSTRLIRENQAVALETLRVKNMMQNHCLARSISDVGWAQFVNMLEYKAERYGKTVLRIGQFEPSSKLCSCGVINRELKLSDREWTCPTCGLTHDRDILAANNIKRMALAPQNLIGTGCAELTLGETQR